MPEFVVASVAPDTRPYEANGPKIAYKVRFQEFPDREVEWSQNASTKPPEHGQRVDGTIDWAWKHGPKFTRTFVQNGSAPSTSSAPQATGAASSSSTDAVGYLTHPVNAARMGRSNAQEMALRYALIHPGAGRKLVEKTGIQALEDVIKPLIDWFQRDVNAAGKLAELEAETTKAYGEVRDPVQTGVSDVPQPASPEEFQSPEPAQPSLEDIPF